jgi:hypothetical protein
MEKGAAPNSSSEALTTPNRTIYEWYALKGDILIYEKQTSL